MASDVSTGSAHDSPAAPATRGQVCALEARMEARIDALDEGLGALGAQLRQILRQLQALQPCRCPPDTAQRLEALEERLHALGVAGAPLPSASAQGSADPQGS